MDTPKTKKSAHFATGSTCIADTIGAPQPPERNSLFAGANLEQGGSKDKTENAGFLGGVRKLAFGSGGRDDHPDAAAGPEHHVRKSVVNLDADVKTTMSAKHRMTVVAIDPQALVRMPTWRQKLIELMRVGGTFETVTTIIILTNAVTMALESEIPEAEKTWELLDQIFLCFYTLELALRFGAFRSKSLKGITNHLDWTIVCVGWMQVFLSGVGADQLSAMNALKVLRALRVLRCIRMLTYVEGLWLVVQSFFYCLRPLMWVCLFMVVIVFIFAMFSVEMIGSSKDFEQIESQKYFVSTVTAFVTLFQIMTLDEWREVIQPLCDKRGWAYIFFFVYISISALALMNLITAVVVENSMKRIEADEEYRNMMFERASQLETEKIQALLEFFQVRNGEEGSGSQGMPGDASENLDESVVRPDDLLMAKGAWSALENVLDALGMDEPEDVQRLFELLDVDGNGELSLNEVIDGLLQLRTVAEDKYKTALIQAMPSHCGKFDLLGRFCQHLPETSTRRLQAIERRLATIQSDLFERIEEVRNQQKVKGGTSSMGSISVSTSDGLRSTAATSETRGPPNTLGLSEPLAPMKQVGGLAPDQIRKSEEARSAMTIEVLSELRKFRGEVSEELQRQASELRRQAGELRKHQESVDQLVTAMVYHE